MNNRLPELLDQYEKNLNLGISLVQSGNLQGGREYLLLAAERLFAIAEASDGELRQVRVDKAYELLDDIESLDQRIKDGDDSELVSVDGDTGESSPKDSTQPACPIEPAPKSDLKLSDVAGLEEVKSLVRDKLIDPFLEPELYAEFGEKTGGGILLYGPPGTGKTFLAQAVAGEVDATFFHVLPSDIMSKWVGDPEKNIRALFAEAGRHQRSVIFFDEIDALASSRERSEDYMRRLVNQLLAEIQGFDRTESAVLVVGATNHPHLVDHAMLRPGRFDELVYVPLPDSAARRALWKSNLSKRKRAGKFEHDELAQSSEGFSGSEIVHMCDQAAKLARQRCQAGNADALIEMQDVRQVLELGTPRTSQGDLEALRRFADQYDRNRAQVEQSCVPPDGNQDQSLNSDFKVMPFGTEMEDFIEKLLAPFPHDQELETALAQLWLGRTTLEITRHIASAVETCWQNEKDPVDPDIRLSLGHFVIPGQEARQVPLSTENSAVKAAAGIGETTDINGPSAPDTQTDRKAAASQVAIPEILVEGMEIIDQYRPQLPRTKVEELTDRLYALADDQGSRWAPVNFESEVILACKQKTESPNNNEQDETKPADISKIADEDLPRQRRDAMRLLGESLGSLTEEDIRGLTEEVAHAAGIDLPEFSGRVEKLADFRARQREELTIRSLLAERGEFLKEDEVAEIEEQLKGESPDYAKLTAWLQKKTWHAKIEQQVKCAVDSLKLDKREAVRLRRKGGRAFERNREVPTRATLNTRLQTILMQMREGECGLQECDPIAESAKIEDVEQLVLPRPPYDFADLAGMDRLRREMEFAVEVPIVPEKRERYTELTGDPPENPAMLLYGAPGCGKTFIALAAAGEFAQRFGFTIIHVPNRTISGIHYSKHTNRIAEIFNLAKRRAPSIVIWDEFDGIAESPLYSGRKHQVSVCTELKHQFEGVIKSGQLVVHIATSNFPWKLDPELMRHGRLGRTIYIPPPDSEARREIIEMKFERASLAEDLDYDQLAEWTENMTVTEIAAITKKCLDDRVKKLEEHWVAGKPRTPGGGLDKLTTPDLELEIQHSPAKALRTWLSGAQRTLSLQKFKSQREFFPNLLKEIDRHLLPGRK